MSHFRGACHRNPRLLRHRLSRAWRFVTLTCQSRKFFAPPSRISSCAPESLRMRSTALTAESMRSRFASIEWSAAHFLLGAGKWAAGLPIIAATNSAAAKAREAVSSPIVDTGLKAASRALRIDSTLPLGTIWSKRSDALSLESVSAAQPPLETGAGHRRTAQQAISMAKPPSRLGLEVLCSFIVGNQFFQQLALFRRLFSRVV